VAAEIDPAADTLTLRYHSPALGGTATGKRHLPGRKGGDHTLAALKSGRAARPDGAPIYVIFDMLTFMRINADDTWTSRTSWSTEREVAEGFVGKNGVILRTTIEEMQDRSVNIRASPENFGESDSCG